MHYTQKKKMHLLMHNNDFDILLRSVHYSAKLQIAKIHKKVQKIKCYLYKASWEFDICSSGKVNSGEGYPNRVASFVLNRAYMKLRTPFALH